MQTKKTYICKLIAHNTLILMKQRFELGIIVKERAYLLKYALPGSQNFDLIWEIGWSLLEAHTSSYF